MFPDLIYLDSFLATQGDAVDKADFCSVGPSHCAVVHRTQVHGF